MLRCKGSEHNLKSSSSSSVAPQAQNSETDHADRAGYSRYCIAEPVRTNQPQQQGKITKLTAPIMPATWVPCPLSSVWAALNSGVAMIRLAAKSGWSHCSWCSSSKGHALN